MRWISNQIMFLVLLLVSVQAKAQFSLGNLFHLSNISGSLTIQCDNKSVTITCRDAFMDPWPYDVFVGPEFKKARSLALHAEADGKVEEVIVDYFGSKGQSEEINLGVSSLFQKPMLKMGENKITYNILDKDNTVLANGDFSVSVAKGGPRSCAPRVTITSNNENCDYPYSLCQMYFKDQNYCK